jgi:quercetin dioxygenase-like cupin family protein
VARGTGRFTVDDETSGVAEGDVIHIGSEEKISFENDGTDPASIYVTMMLLPKQH